MEWEPEPHVVCCVSEKAAVVEVSSSSTAFHEAVECMEAGIPVESIMHKWDKARVQDLK